MKIKTILTTILCSLVFTVVAQVHDLPRKELNGKEYYVYKVEKGEGLYSISKKFGITEEEIIKYNPAVKRGVKRNQLIFIPIENGNSSQTKSYDSAPFRHTIKRGETLSAIAKMYNVTVDEICQLNPGNRDRINAGDKLFIPQQNSSNNTTTTVAVDNQALDAGTTTTTYQYHTIESGETLYAIANKYNVTVESIIRSNPGIQPRKLAKGAVIRIAIEQPVVATVESAIETPQPIESVEAESREALQADAPVVEEAPQYRTYIAKKRETLYSISRKFDLSLDSLKAINPDVRKVKEGTVINLPLEKPTEDNVEPYYAQDINEYSRTPEQIESIYNRIYAKKDIDHINVAVMLPFMLKENGTNAQQSIRAALFTEYYEGFLLAVDSLKRQGYSINLYAYDTERSIERVRSILDEPIMTTMDLIIAPDEDNAIDVIADFGEKYDINIVNNFSMKNDKVETNARLFQTNIPGSYLYAESVAYFIQTFKNRNIVLLHNTHEKDTTDNEFIATLKEEFERNNIPYSICQYNDVIELKDLQKTTIGSSVAFLPTSNKKELLASLLPVIEEFAHIRPSCDVSLVGYPSWVTQISKYANKFYKLDTYIFSRFFTQPNDPRLYDLSLKYMYWYNDEMKNASPRYAIMGYDTGMYFLTAIAKGGKNFANYDMMPHIESIQTDFNFERINNWSGFINKACYYIHFTPDLQIEKIAL